jgi:hypothetical protein
VPDKEKADPKAGFYYQIQKMPKGQIAKDLL